MSNNWTIRHTVDLKKGGGHNLDGGALMFPGDRLGHTWEITVLEDGKKANLAGGSVNGYFCRSDGNYVAVNGGISSGNICRVTLTEECYAYAGPLRGVMRLTINGQIVTLADVSFRVRAGLTGDPVSGGETIPSIDDLLAMIDTLEADTAAAEAVINSLDPLVEMHYEDKQVQNNLFDPDHYMNIEGSRLDTWGGLVTDSATTGYGVSAFIPVAEGRHYMADLGVYGATERICFYDGDISPLPAATALQFPKTQCFQPPEGAACMRVTYKLGHDVVVEEYAPQGSNLIDAYSRLNSDNRYMRRNLADTGMQWNRSDGWGMSWYIPVNYGTTYRFCYSGEAGGPRVIAFDADFAFCGELEGTADRGAWWTLTLPGAGGSGSAAHGETAYIRIPYAKPGRYSMAALAAGSTAPALFEPFHGAREGRGDPFKAVLPDTVYCAVGVTVEIYNAQVVLHPERFVVRWLCDTGYSLGRKFSVTGTAATDAEHSGNVGSHALTLQVLDRHGRMLYNKRATLVITGGLSAGKRLLMIGDSLTKCDKPVIAEMLRLSGGLITTTGLRSGRARDSAGTLPETYYSEAESGRSPFYYISNSNSPFVTNGAFDWSGYLAKLTEAGRSAPQAVHIMLGTNGMGTNPALAARQIGTMVDGIRAVDSSIPILVSETIFRGSQDAIGRETGSDGYAGGTVGASKDLEDEKVMDLAAALMRELAGKSGVYFLGVGACMDSAYNFGLRAVPVNPRNRDYEELVPWSPGMADGQGGTDSIHPQACGYYQMADVIYSALSAIL